MGEWLNLDKWDYINQTVEKGCVGLNFCSGKAGEGRILGIKVQQRCLGNQLSRKKLYRYKEYIAPNLKIIKYRIIYVTNSIHL